MFLYALREKILPLTFNISPACRVGVFNRPVRVSILSHTPTERISACLENVQTEDTSSTPRFKRSKELATVNEEQAEWKRPNGERPCMSFAQQQL